MQHIKQIDVLRGIAIFLVLVHHFCIPYKIDELLLIARNGNYGVTMFFVISGFLITQTTLNRQSSIANFYIRRCARILPCLFLLLAIVTVLGQFGFAPFVNHAPNGIAVSYVLTVLSVLTFSMNMLIIKYGWVNYALGVLWSLSVEEVFYFAFPIISLLKNKFKYAIFFGLILYAPFIRASYFLDPNEAYLYHYFASFDAIAIGCLTAFLWDTLRLNKFCGYTAILVMTALYFVAPIKDISTWSMSVFAVATAVLILSFKTAMKTTWLSKFLIAIGQKSYELYLFHLIILGLIKVYFIPSQTDYLIKLMLLVVYLLGAYVLAYLIERYYSSALNGKIRKRFIS